MNRKRKCIIIYTEGETENELYNALLEEIKKVNKIDKFSADKIVVNGKIMFKRNSQV